MFKFVRARHLSHAIKHVRPTRLYFFKIFTIKATRELKSVLLRNALFLKNKIKQKRTLFFFAYSYKTISRVPQLFIFFLLKKIKKNTTGVVNNILLKFFNSKSRVSLQNKKKKDFLALAPGFFLKYFEKKKSKKKTKVIKILMMRFLRKIFIFLKIYKFNIYVKSNPVNLNEMLTAFRTPIIAPFKIPSGLDPIDENLINRFRPKFNYFIFLNTTFYHKRKLKKKGRIKRKILRKLVLENKLVD